MFRAHPFLLEPHRRFPCYTQPKICTAIYKASTGFLLKFFRALWKARTICNVISGGCSFSGFQVFLAPYTVQVFIIKPLVLLCLCRELMERHLSYYTFLCLSLGVGWGWNTYWTYCPWTTVIFLVHFLLGLCCIYLLLLEIAALGFHYCSDLFLPFAI